MKISYGILFVLMHVCFGTNAGIIINELEPNPAGADNSTQIIEIFGTANSQFDDLTLLAIEADASSNIGSINTVETGLSGQFNSDGIGQLVISDLENPSFVLALIQGSFSFENDLDAENDGYLDVANWFDSVLDAVGIYDSHSDYSQSHNYATQLGGTSLLYSGSEPELVFRDSGDKSLYALNKLGDEQVFDKNSVSVALHRFSSVSFAPTFGATNPSKVAVVSEPSPFYFMLMSALVFFIRTRH